MSARAVTRPEDLTARAGGILRRVDRLSGVICALAVVLLVSLLVTTALGYRLLIEHSGSMQPAISPGALVITHPQPARRVGVGEIVSFDDPALQGRLVTHRLVATHQSGGRIEFLTRGDANRTPESWSVPRSGAVAVMRWQIAGVGRAIAWLVEPWVRTVLLTLAALVLSTALLRRIWSA